MEEVVHGGGAELFGEGDGAVCERLSEALPERHLPDRLEEGSRAPPLEGHSVQVLGGDLAVVVQVHEPRDRRGDLLVVHPEVGHHPGRLEGRLQVRHPELPGPVGRVAPPDAGPDAGGAVERLAGERAAEAAYVLLEVLPDVVLLVRPLDVRPLPPVVALVVPDDAGVGGEEALEVRVRPHVPRDGDAGPPPRLPDGLHEPAVQLQYPLRVVDSHWLGPPDGDRLEPLRTHRGADRRPAPVAVLDRGLDGEVLPCGPDARDLDIRIFQLLPYQPFRLEGPPPPDRGGVPDLHVVVVDGDVDGLIGPPLDDYVVVPGELELGGPRPPHPDVTVRVALRLGRRDRRDLHPRGAYEARPRKGPRPEDQGGIRVVWVLLHLAVLEEEPCVPAPRA